MWLGAGQRTTAAQLRGSLPIEIIRVAVDAGLRAWRLNKLEARYAAVTTTWRGKNLATTVLHRLATLEMIGAEDMGHRCHLQS